MKHFFPLLLILTAVFTAPAARAATAGDSVIVKPDIVYSTQQHTYILGGFVGGAVIGALKTKMYMFGGSGLFGIFNYAGGGGMQDIIKYLIGIAVGGIFAIVATLMVYDDDEATRVLG